MSHAAELHTVWDVVGGVRVRGRVSARPLTRRDDTPHAVFVHGLGMATNYLEPTMRALENEIAVSALDLPGFGGSRPIVGHRSLAELAEALVAWVRMRGIVAPIFVGQSHGCQVVVEAVTRAPDLASALVLNAPTMVAEHRSIGAQLWRVMLDTPREPLALVPHVARDYLRAGPVRILATLRDALRDRIEDKLPTVRVPVTIVTGARDPVSPPAWGERLARLTRSHAGAEARFVIVPGAAHAVPFSHPEALAAEVVSMARRLDATRAPR
ncbi:MAG: alpha/beta hydrolase [Gemmatimonadetes bacterium]|nr:MAG: alpha/beta hydrolase [Gemmatimonadota bacterium]